ncbi:hypothetical protein FRC02_006998 [Tulasnella sp. 418]|nr:hypothetical protein FRC02_006998 [Tulasnella sp. 418]
MSFGNDAEKTRLLPLPVKVNEAIAGQEEEEGKVAQSGLEMTSRLHYCNKPRLPLLGAMIDRPLHLLVSLLHKSPKAHVLIGFILPIHPLVGRIHHQLLTFKYSPERCRSRREWKEKREKGVEGEV